MSFSWRLFGISGISVHLHWTWLLVAWFMIDSRRDHYHYTIFAAAEYLMLFLIVLLHEFGHALAARSVGGQADRIVLWPLGGIAFVRTPPRPGAQLWSIVAGPLVNVALVPLTLPLAIQLWNRPGDLAELVRAVSIINLALLIFNLLPIFPLDGGQILQSLLWFIVGRGRSLVIAGWIGVVGAVGGLAAASYFGVAGFWLALIAVFAALQAWGAVHNGRMLMRFEQVPRRFECTCPRCGAHPPAAPVWSCDVCGIPADPLQTPAGCPRCGVPWVELRCPDCGMSSPILLWRVVESVPVDSHYA